MSLYSLSFGSVQFDVVNLSSGFIYRVFMNLVYFELSVTAVDVAS